MKYCDRFKEENESVMERFQLSMETASCHRE